MSGRSPAKQLITAGLIGVGVGVLAAGVGYAIVNRSPTTCSPQLTERKTGRRVNSPDRKSISPNRNGNSYHESYQCKICGKDISSEPSASLTCDHSFHRKCLFSSYIVQTQVNKGSIFRCPFDACQIEIPESILESLIDLH